jgi:hypothetical protein
MRRILNAGIGDRQKELDTGLARTILETSNFNLKRVVGHIGNGGKGARFALKF